MVTSTTTIAPELATRLSAEFNRCFTDFEAPPHLFASDSFFDLLPPMWRFQFEGPGDAFTEQLRSIAEEHTAAGDKVARRIHLCEVDDGRISAVTTYCNGGWDEEHRAQHAAEAPMVRP